jgi:pyridoxamine 5'-phosphate oxidase
MDQPSTWYQLYLAGGVEALSEHSLNARREFIKGVLLEEDLPNSPLKLLLVWHGDAHAAGLDDANAMNLSTIDLDGFPVCRTVLLRDATEEGLSFYTNYQSDKGREMSRNPRASLQFFWPGLERQVRVRGRVIPLDPKVSDSYFASRPRDSQIGAWASPQSQVIASRDILEAAFRAYSQKFSQDPHIPRPPHWGGYQLVADQFEFWQGRPSRLHDRLRARRSSVDPQGPWVWQRLAP